MTKTAILIFLLWIIFWSIGTFYLSLRFFSNFSFQNLVLPSIDNIAVLTGENLKLKDQISSEFRKQKSEISNDMYNQLKNSIKQNFDKFISW